MGNAFNYTSITTKQFLIDAVDNYCKYKRDIVGNKNGLVYFAKIDSKKYVESIFKITKLSWPPRLFEGDNLWKIIAEHVKLQRYRYNELTIDANNIGILIDDSHLKKYCNSKELCNIVMRADVFTGFIRNLYIFIRCWPQLIHDAFSAHDNFKVDNNCPWNHSEWRQDAKKILYDVEILNELVEYITIALAEQWPVKPGTSQAVQSIFSLLSVSMVQELFNATVKKKYLSYTDMSLQCELFRYIEHHVYDFDLSSFRLWTYTNNDKDRVNSEIPECVLNHQQSCERLEKKYCNYRENQISIVRHVLISNIAEIVTCYSLGNRKHDSVVAYQQCHHCSADVFNTKINNIEWISSYSLKQNCCCSCDL